MMPAGLSSLTVASLSAFDWCVLVFIFLSTVGALRRGMIRVIFSIAGLAAGIVIAGWNYVRLAMYVNPWIHDLAIAQGVAFVSLMVAALAVTSVFASFFTRSASAVGLGAFNRLCGAIFGFLRGVLLAAVATMALVAFVPNADLLKNSRLAGYLLGTAHKISFVVPEYLQEQLAAGTSHLLQQSPKPFRPEP